MSRCLYEKKGFLINSILFFLVITIVFFFKNIYPFGNNLFNVIDFDYGYVPVYYKLWDLLHGVGSIFFDWNLGAGLNCFGSLVSNSLLSPTSLIVFIFNRSFIPYAMNYILILKLYSISVISYYSIKKLFPKNKTIYTILFSLIYTFSGYTWLMMSNILYLDVVALFPLLVYSYYLILKSDKYWLYLIVLTLCLILSFYSSYQILFIIVGATILSMLFLNISYKRKKIIMIMLLTLLSLGLSCFCFLPSFYQSITSYRLSIVDDYPVIRYTFEKASYIIPLILPIFFFIKQLFTKNKKINIYIVLIVLYCTIGIVLDPINRMWHTGSYWMFPYRYGFITTFILECISLYYLNYNYKEKFDKKILFNYLCIGLSTIIYLFIVLISSKSIINMNISDSGYYSNIVFIVLIFLLLLGIIIYYFIYRIRNNNILLIVYTVFFIISFGYLYFVNYDIVTSINTDKVKTDFKLKDKVYNYKDETSTLNTNYPYILQVPSTKNRLHIIKKSEIDIMNSLGYNISSTIVNTVGGTVFSDYLLQNKYIFSNLKLDDKLYNLKDYKNSIYYYESDYYISPLLFYNGKDYNKDYDNIFDNQNNIYKNLFDENDDLLCKVDFEDNDKETKFNIKKNRVYYIEAKISNELSFDYKKYNLDYFKMDYINEKLLISFESKDDRELIINKKDFNISVNDVRYIDIDQFIKFVNNNNHKVDVKVDGSTKTYTFVSDKDSSVLIPTNYEEGFIITLNGKSINYKKNLYNMVSVDIKKGNNVLKVSFVPKMLKEGIIITIVCILLIIIFYFSNKKLNYINNKIILNILFIISSLIYVLFFIKMYVLSFF